MFRCLTTWRGPSRMSAQGLFAAMCVIMFSWVAFFAEVHPAHALTPTEKYVDRIYRDFLLRPATSAELAWGSAYLAGQSRHSYLDSFFVSGGFRAGYVTAVHLRYLGRAPTSGEQTGADSALQSTGNHLATEADVMASSSYFALADNVVHEYVRTLYWDVLAREGPSTDVDFWADRIIDGVQTRRQVAVSFLRSSEAALLRVNGFSAEPACPSTSLERFDDINDGSYCIILDRKGSGPDASFWAASYSAGGQLVGVWVDLAASTEYWNLAQV